MYRDGHREGYGEILYESVESNLLVKRQENKDKEEGKVTIDEQKNKKNYEYDDDEENDIVVNDEDGTSTNRRLPLRYSGRWEQSYIMPRAIHSQKYVFISTPYSIRHLKLKRPH
jgi:hypothetical protein